MQTHSICAYLRGEAVIKSTVIVVVTLVVGFFSTSDKVITQESILSATNPATWIYTYDNNNRYTEASSIVSTSNGDYIVAGKTSIFREPNDFFLTKVNNAGINQWQKVFDYGSSDVDVIAIRSLPGSEEYIILLNLSEGYTNISIILRIDSDGNVIWQKKYDVDGISTARLRDMIVTRSGDILVVGSIPVNNQEMNGLIAKISQSGTVLWVKSYDNSYDESQFTKVTATESLNGVIELTDGSILAVGSISFDSGDKKERYLDSWVMKLDTTGTLLWQKSIGKLEDEFGHGFIDEYAATAIETSEGKYIIVGVSFRTKGPYPTCGYNTGHVFEVNENGQLDWQKEYIINYDEICRSFIPTKALAVGNDLLVTSNPYDESMLMKITNNGSILRQHKYAAYKYSEEDRYRNYVSVKTALVDTEQKILLGGSAGDTNTNWDMWLARTDAQGIVDSSCGRAEVSFDTNITVEEIAGTSPNYTLTNVNTHDIQATAIAALSVDSASGKADFLCYDIAGSVVDASGNPIAGVAINATGIDIVGSGSTTSNLEGKFRIKSLDLGMYRVEATKLNHQFQTQEVTVPINNMLLTSRIPELPIDIQVSKPEFSKVPPFASNHFVVSSVVENLGEETATQLVIKFFVSQSGQQQKQIGETHTIDMILPQEKVNVSIDWVLTSNQDNVIVAAEARVDAATDIAPMNNRAETPVSIYYAPFQHNVDAFSFRNWSYLLDADVEDLGAQFRSALDLDRYPMHAFGILYPLYLEKIKIGGHCYGMSATSILYQEFPEIKPAPVDTYKLTKNQVRGDIEKYSTTQIVHVMESMLGGDDIMEEFQNVQNSIRDEGKPIMLLLSKKEGFGDHAIVAHSIVDLGAEKKIFVYENKVPLSESNAAFFATLKIDSKFLTYVGSEYSFIARSPLLAPTDVSDIIVTGLLDHLVTELQTQNRIRIFIGSPVDPIITDAQGRVTGITGGNELTQIPGSTVSVYGTKKVIDLPFADSYTLTLNGTSEGVMTIQVLVPQESDTRIIQYNNVPVTQNLTASLRINPTSSTGWEMQISNDTEREPDINSLYGESQDNLFLPLISR